MRGSLAVGRTWPSRPAQAQTKMDQYTIPTPAADYTAGAAGSSPRPSVPEPDLSAILKAIHDSREAVEHKVDELRIELSLIQQNLQGVTGRVIEAETLISTTEVELATLQKQILKLMSSVTALHERAEDAKNRARLNNLRLVGLPENLDDPDLAVTLKRWFHTWVTSEKLSPHSL
ncbi:hypothetical protein NDU88_006293 [Pleurodeles waltl]|uniref:Uncharacterized protein n=1 Tax=Pleurodeles waltl TaxID=8319 RepID=A0AAV7RMM7_PLEWA|nr:hypothetical protein NDU88_006293 [Pleurodeles waltl]